MATTAVTMMMNMKMLTTMMMTQMLAMMMMMMMMMMMILMLMLMLMMVMTAMVVMMVMAVMLEMMVFAEVAARIPWSLKSHPSLRHRGTPQTRNRGVPEARYRGHHGAVDHLACNYHALTFRRLSALFRGNRVFHAVMGIGAFVVRRNNGNSLYFFLDIKGPNQPLQVILVEPKLTISL